MGDIARTGFLEDEVGYGVPDETAEVGGVDFSFLSKFSVADVSFEGNGFRNVKVVDGSKGEVIDALQKMRSACCADPFTDSRRKWRYGIHPKPNAEDSLSVPQSRPAAPSSQRRASIVPSKHPYLQEKLATQQGHLRRKMGLRGS